MPRLISRTRRAALLEAVLRGLARLSLPAVHRLGDALGWLLAALPNLPRRLAARNLELCLPELDAAARARLLRASLRETACGMLELGPLWCWPAERQRALVRASQGEAAFAAAVAAGHGVIVLSPHLGAWEVSGQYISSRWPITSLYRPSRLGIDALVRSGRERLGARLVPTDAGGVRALLAALRRGEVAGILPDQDPGRGNGVFAPFFGVSANTMTLVSRLAQRSRAPVFLACAERLPRGAGFCVHFTPCSPAIGREPLAESVTALNADVEAAVRRLPAQYLWAYKRFRTRPDGEAKLY